MSRFKAFKKVKLGIAYALSLLCLVTAYLLDHSNQYKEFIDTYKSSYGLRRDFLIFFWGNIFIYVLYLIDICFPLLLTYFLLKKK